MGKSLGARFFMAHCVEITCFVSHGKKLNINPKNVNIYDLSTTSINK